MIGVIFVLAMLVAYATYIYGMMKILPEPKLSKADLKFYEMVEKKLK